MKKILITSVAAIMIFAESGNAHADNASKKEMAGAGAGAVVGGAVGGPPGAIIGAAVGALFGDRSHQKDNRLDALTETTERQASTVATLNHKLDNERSESQQLKRELRALDESGVRELHALLSRGLEIDMPFKTDAIAVDKGSEQRLLSIADLLAETPGLSVQIDGYADPRGSVEYNAALSLQRAEAVRALLNEVGIGNQRITSFGHGESASVSDSELVDLDQLALQRRVTVTFYRDDAVSGVAALAD
ncbi:MAG: OmpA family protein [Woeseiaceae bacterium]